MTGCTSHADWLPAEAKNLPGIATTKCGVICDTAVQRFLGNIMLSLKCQQSLLSARRSTDILSYIQIVLVGIPEESMKKF